MEPYQRQQFDLLLQLGVESFVERLQHRNGSATAALEALRRDPEGDGVWLGEFTRVLLADQLLDDAAGAAFVLQALARQPVPVLPAVPAGARIEELLRALAHHAFARLLANKTEEALEQRAGYEAVDVGAAGSAR